MRFEWHDKDRSYIALYHYPAITVEQIKNFSENYDELQVWYPQAVDDEVYNRYCEVLSYIERDGHWNGNSYTYEFDLLLEEEDLRSNLSKNNRYKINRAENKDKITIKFLENITKNDIEEYCDFYNAFIYAKGFGCPKDGNKELELSEKKQFFIARAFSSEGIKLAEHTFLIDSNRVLHYTSASGRFEYNEMSSMIGRAGRLILFKSMMYFKKMGYEIFDFSGGYPKGNIEELQNIDEYKRSFGGKLKEYRSGYIVPLSNIKTIEQNIEYNLDKFKNNQIILWGYGKFGKYFDRRLQELMGKSANIIIDNKLKELDNGIVGDEVLSTDLLKNAVLVIAMDRTLYTQPEVMNKLMLFEYEKLVFLR